MNASTRARWSAYAADLARAWRRPPRIKPSRWVASHVRLPKRVSAIHGFYSTDVAPYQREPLDAWVDPEVDEMVLMWATQTGKTQNTVLLNGFTAACDPGPAFVAAPSSAKAKDLSTQKMEPVYEASPDLAAMLPPKRERQDLRMELDAQVIYFGWSGSAIALGDISARYAYFIEIDKFSSRKSTEADPLKLAEERVKFFSNAKKLYDGSPTIKGLSRIEKKFLSSDRRRYHVPCPHCGRWQLLIFGAADSPGGIKWPRVPGAEGKPHSCDPETARAEAWYECAHCRGKIVDADKPTMLRRGIWVPDGQTARPATREELESRASSLKPQASSPIVEAYDGTPMVLEGTPDHPIRRRRGYQLASWYSPVLTFGQCAEAWLSSQGDYREEQNFWNSWAAEAWEIRSQALEWQELYERCHDDRAAGEVPAEAEVVAMGCDPMKGFTHYDIRAFTADGRSWLVADGQAPSLADCEEIRRTSRWPVIGADESRGVDIAVYDARYRTSEVEDLVLAAGPSVRAVMGAAIRYGNFRFQPAKGSAVSGKMLRMGYGHWALHSDYYKDLLTSMVHRPKGHPHRWLIHREVGELYLKGLLTEAFEEERDKRGRIVRKWIVVDPNTPNHPLDCECYCLAAWEMWKAGWGRILRPRAVLIPESPRDESRRDDRRRGDLDAGRAWDGEI